MAKRIPREFIQLLLSRIEIIDLIDARVPLRKKSSNNYFACCPFHTEKSASFSVSQNKQFFYCFGCGAHGNALDFVMQFDRLSFPEAVEQLARHAGVEVPSEIQASEKPSISSDSYQLLENVAKFYQQQLKQFPNAIQYLKARGLSGEIAKEFGVGFAPSGWDHLIPAFGTSTELKHLLHETGMLIKKEDGGFYDRFRERIMFPIHDRRGRVIGFGGRIIEKGEPKYLNSPETAIFQKGHELYGLYHALKHQRQLTKALVVEGYMDVIALFQHDIQYAVATLGTATTSSHFQRLLRYTNEIVFCFDGDQAGRTAAWRALVVILPLMRDDIQVRFMFLPDGEDPDSLVRKEGKSAFEARMRNAATFSTFFFQSLAAKADMSNMDGRARFVKLATEHLAQLPKGIFNQMMQEELAKRAGLTPPSLQNINPKHQHRFTPPKARTPSALRLALSLIIQHPELAKLVETPLPPLDLKGYDLLNALIEQAKQQDHLTTGALLEHWREKEESPVLAKLALHEHMIPEGGINNEFLGAITQLAKMSHQQAIEKLLAKANQTTLSPAEKQLLQELIHSK